MKRSGNLHLRTISESPRIAVIGAGLAGLSAAYHLRHKYRVVIYEKTSRIGGRVFTSHQLEGEHGAEFLLGRRSEPFINKLVKTLNVKITKEIPDWPGYLFHGQFAKGSPKAAAEKFLSPESAHLFNEICGKAQAIPRLKKKIRFHEWLSKETKSDKDCLRFVDMLIRGDSCAPLDHISIKYGLGCLSSLFDSWYRIKGGTGTLATALFNQSKSTIEFGTSVTNVRKVREGVHVRWTKDRKSFSDLFQGVIITVPEGERLLGQKVKGHFHSYVSVLIGYRFKPKLKIDPAFRLKRGLYTDSPLNYIQLTRDSLGLYVIRVLIPDAGERANQSQKDLLDYCVKHLGVIVRKADQFCSWRIKSWGAGLPCGGYGNLEAYFVKDPPIFMAGDRFEEWPSMEAALSSGAQAARALDRFLCK